MLIVGIYGPGALVGFKPLLGKTAGILKGCGVRLQLVALHLGFIRPRHIKTFVKKPVFQTDRGTKKHIVVEIKIALRQTGNVMDVGLDVPLIKCRQS